MRLVTALLTTTYLAGTALAVPQNSRLGDRIRARALSRQSQPLTPSAAAEYEDHEAFRMADTSPSPATTTTIVYSNNWAGAVRENPPAAGPYTAVSATFTVPKPTAVSSSSSSNTQAGSAWVGIDGDTYNTAILQTGIDFYTQNGKTYNDAWFEWFPDYAYDFNLQINTGDVIVAKVQSSSPSEGVAIIENRSTGQKATQTVKAPAATATLAGQNAEWIVEDFQSGSSIVALADFSSVTFSGAQASAGGQMFGLHGATVVELKQNNQVLTEVVVNSDSELTVNCKIGST